MKFHLVFDCTGLCEPRCNELHVTFVYKMDADMNKAGKTIPSLSLFLHFAVVFIHIFFDFELFLLLLLLCSSLYHPSKKSCHCISNME